MRATRLYGFFTLLMLALCAPVAPQRASRADLRAIRQYIKRGWRTLERGPAQPDQAVEEVMQVVARGNAARLEDELLVGRAFGQIVLGHKAPGQRLCVGQ